jgi:hypothetical protein
MKTKIILCFESNYWTGISYELCIWPTVLSRKIRLDAFLRIDPSFWIEFCWIYVIYSMIYHHPIISKALLVIDPAIWTTVGTNNWFIMSSLMIKSNLDVFLELIENIWMEFYYELLICFVILHCVMKDKYFLLIR